MPPFLSHEQRQHQLAWLWDTVRRRGYQRQAIQGPSTETPPQPAGRTPRPSPSCRAARLTAVAYRALERGRARAVPPVASRPGARRANSTPGARQARPPPGGAPAPAAQPWAASGDLKGGRGGGRGMGSNGGRGGGRRRAVGAEGEPPLRTAPVSGGSAPPCAQPGVWTLCL